MSAPPTPSTATATLSVPVPGPTSRLTTAPQAARAFRHLRWRLTCNAVRLLFSGSRLRLSMILICSAIFWVVLFGLLFGGFQFIRIYDRDLKDALIEYLFSMFFLSLLAMLFFSTGILTYTGLFQSRVDRSSKRSRDLTKVPMRAN